MTIHKFKGWAELVYMGIYVMCKKYVNPEFSTKEWSKVTCKNCLRKKE